MKVTNIIEQCPLEERKKISSSTDRKYIRDTRCKTKSNPVSNRGETSSMQQHEDPLQNVLEQSARALASHPSLANTESTMGHG